MAKQLILLLVFHVSVAIVRAPLAGIVYVRFCVVIAVAIPIVAVEHSKVKVIVTGSIISLVMPGLKAAIFSTMRVLKLNDCAVTRSVSNTVGSSSYTTNFILMPSETLES